MKWFTENDCLDALGITSDCCPSCSEDAYGGYEIPQADANGYVVDSCCIHVGEIQSALEDGTLHRLLIQ